jgi:carbonic anhydrase
MTADDLLTRLKEGNQRFLNGETAQSSKASLLKLKEFAQNGQLPKVIVLCCSDSRAPVEMIFDQDLGDLFVIRVAGNIVAPSIVGSVEFAASLYNVKLVLVMGHSKCGAVKAALDFIETKGSIESSNMSDLVSRIKPHIYPIAKFKKMKPEEKMELAVETNVRASVSQLAHSSRLIESLVLGQNIHIAGAVLDLDTGVVEFLDEA